MERLINLRARVRMRLIQNAEVVGSDESFFDDDDDDMPIRDLYTEKNGILDDDGDTEVDLASYAYQIWKNATDADPSLAPLIEAMPDVVYATKEHEAEVATPKGVLIYMRTAQGNDALTWVDESGVAVTQSQLTILKAAACRSDTLFADDATIGQELSIRRCTATGGIRPPEPHRSRLALTLAERDEVSRTLVIGHSIRSIAARIGRAPSTVSREIERNGRRVGHRASLRIARDSSKYAELDRRPAVEPVPHALLTHSPLCGIFMQNND